MPLSQDHSDGPVKGASSGQEPPAVSYHVCPCCLRATPAAVGENFCPNDGARMLTGCPRCGSAILAPFGEFCANCGAQLADEG